MDQSTKNLDTITKFIKKISSLASAEDIPTKPDFNIQIGDITPAHCLEKFSFAINDNLNTSLALSILYRFISVVNKVENLSQEQINSILSFWKKVNIVLGLNLDLSEKIISIPEEITELSKKRDQARQDKDFDLADELRDKIIAKGYSLEDTSEGVILTRM